MPIMRYLSQRFVPTANRASNDSSGTSVLRGKNLFIRGRGDSAYSECYGGSLSLGEPIPVQALTGLISFDVTSKTVVGADTFFLTELSIGQRIQTLAGAILVVAEILSSDEFSLHSYPTTSEAGVVGYRLPVLFEMDKKRGTLLAGNAMEFDRGNILCVGIGDLRVNGHLLTDSLTASRRIQIAVYNANTGQYLIQRLGFDSLPAGISLTNGAAPASQTYVDSDVTTGVGTSNINITAHGYQTGQQVLPSTPGTLAAPLLANTNVYVIRVDANNIQLATTLANAVVGNEINFTTQGAGTTTLTPGSKNMPAGDRSIRVAKASDKLSVPTYGNPGENLKITITAGQTIDISFPPMDSNADPNNPHDAWRVYASLFGGTTTTATAAADSGPWYLVRTITAAELGGTGAGHYYLEYLDAEIEGTLRLITFDNDPPCDASFVGTVAGYPVLVSCQGKPNPDSLTGTAPGPSIVPFKPSNLAAAPLVLDSDQRNEVPLSPPEQIVGLYMAAGRLYLLTANTLQIAVFTADQDFPVATRPFWKAGFRNPYALCFVNGRLYGFTGSGATRSVADGEEGSEEHTFAADVQELMQDWLPENVFVVHDPKNECICYVHAGGTKNADDYWITEVVPFMLRNEEWSHEIIFTDSARDCIVTGVATVSSHFEFLMGGRNGEGAIDISTRRFDEPSGETVPYSEAFQFFDGGDEERVKKVKQPSVRGKITSGSGTIGIFGTEPGEAIDVDIITTGGNVASKSGAIPLEDGLGVLYRTREEVMVQGLENFTVNVEGEWDGDVDAGRDRIDEIILTYETYGRRF